jgi:hypothetical protein
MRRFTGTSLLVAALLLPQAAAAQDVIPRPLNSTETLKLTGVSQAEVASWDNVYLGPYDGAILSGSPTIPSLTLYCVDFAHGVSVGNVWNVDVTNIGSGASDGVSGTLGNTRLGNVQAEKFYPDFPPGGASLGYSLDRYRQAAFLASLFSSYATFQDNSAFTYGSNSQFTSQKEVYSGIHAAIWSIMTDGFPNTIGGITNVVLAAAMADPFVNMAVSARTLGYTGLTTLGVGFNSMNFDEWSVLTDVVDPGKQEYLVQTTSVVPEPGTYVLLLSGLILLWGVARRRRGSLVA